VLTQDIVVSGIVLTKKEYQLLVKIMLKIITIAQTTKPRQNVNNSTCAEY